MAKTVNAAHIDRRLAELPTISILAARDDARLVASSAGIFVVVGDVGGVNGAAEGAYELARKTRTSLSDVLMPTPHVESVVVSREAPRQTFDSIVIFPYQLPKLVESGNNIDSIAVDRLAALLASSDLAPGWELLNPNITPLAA